MQGKKDVISTKTNGTKRKRLLLDDISNVHRMYLEEHTDNPIGKSNFFQLRPLWMILVNKQSVCKCVYHENVNNCRVERLYYKQYLQIILNLHLTASVNQMMITND